MRRKRSARKAGDLLHAAVGELRGDETGRLDVQGIGKPVQESDRVISHERGEPLLFPLVYLLKIDGVFLFGSKNCFSKSYAGAFSALFFHSWSHLSKRLPVFWAASFHSSHSSILGSRLVPEMPMRPRRFIISSLTPAALALSSSVEPVFQPPRITGQAHLLPPHPPAPEGRKASPYHRED